MKNRDKFEQVWKVYYKNSVEGVLDQKTAMLIKEVASAFSINVAFSVGETVSTFPVLGL